MNFFLLILVMEPIIIKPDLFDSKLCSILQSNIDIASSWALVPWDVDKNDMLRKDNGSLLFPIESAHLHCCLCTEDLCGEIYQCGNGLHMFCAYCIKKLPQEILYAAHKRKRHENNSNSRSGFDSFSLYQPNEQIFWSGVYEEDNSNMNLNINSDIDEEDIQAQIDPFMELLQTLNTSSPAPRMTSRKRKSHLSSTHNNIITTKFQCPYCCTDTCYTRARWLEQSISCFVYQCPYKNCCKKVLRSSLEEHKHQCAWRPYCCLWCDHEFNDFDADIFIEHIQSQHKYLPLNFNIEEPTSEFKLDLSVLKIRGDCGFYYKNNFVQHTQRFHFLFLLITLQSQNDSGLRFFEVKALDMSYRAPYTQNENIIDIQLHINLIAQTFAKIDLNEPTIQAQEKLTLKSCSKILSKNKLTKGEDNESEIKSTENNSKSIQHQEFSIKYQPYQDHLNPHVHIITLLPDSFLFLKHKNFVPKN